MDGWYGAECEVRGRLGGRGTWLGRRIAWSASVASPASLPGVFERTLETWATRRTRRFKGPLALSIQGQSCVGQGWLGAVGLCSDA